MRISSGYFRRRYSYSSRKKSYAMIILFITLFFTVGYAYLNTMLTINGNTTVRKNTWDVHFENIVKVDGSIDATSEAVIVNDTVINFTADLSLPGDFYSFTVDVVNDGSIDAMLSEILKTGLTVSQEEYVIYTVTYSDGEEILAKDSLPSGKQDQLLVLVKYRDDVDTSILPTEDQSIVLNLNADYVQDDGTSTDRRRPRTLYDEIVLQNQEDGSMVLDNEGSTYVSTYSGIDFAVAPSDTNGKGVYVRNGTETDKYPIYYYRGAVTNNNVLFANYCWKIVRTTETGGVKLIYNGTQKEVYESVALDSSEYINITHNGEDEYPNRLFAYNDSDKMWDLEYTSSNWGEYGMSFSIEKPGNYILNYEIELEESIDDYVYIYLDGNYFNGKEIATFNTTAKGSILLEGITPSNVISVEFWKSSYNTNDMIKFNIASTTGNIIKTCDNTGEESQIGTTAFNSSSDYNAYLGYMYGTPNSSTYEAEHLSTKESTSSTIKTAIDTWYSNNMTSYTSYLEDTVWCNDRSFARISDVTGTGTSSTYYGVYERVYTASNPSLECTNQNDRFTVNEIMNGRVNGNGALTYPVSLLTADELTLAGYVRTGYNVDLSSNYLMTDQNWWSLSPNRFSDNLALVTVAHSDGILSVTSTSNERGIRPAVSLLLGTEISKNGDGSVISPFVVE